MSNGELVKELDKAIEVIGKMYCMLYINNLDHNNEFEFDVVQAKRWMSYYEKLKTELTVQEDDYLERKDKL